MSKQLDYQIKETSFFQILWLSKCQDQLSKCQDQAQDLKYQINQYLSEILIVTLGIKVDNIDNNSLVLESDHASTYCFFLLHESGRVPQSPHVPAAEQYRDLPRVPTYARMSLQ